MNEERRRILNLLADRRISAEEADGLLEALGGGAPAAPASTPASELGSGTNAPKFLRVVVEGYDDQAEKVNVRVPLALIRAGMRLTALLPTVANDQISKALKDKGVDVDLSKLKPENFDELVDQLRALTVDVSGKAGEKVRVYCE